MTNIQIKNMTIIERLQTMEAIWDSLLDEDFKIKSPEWHNDIINDRRKKIKNKETEFITLDKLKKSPRL